MPDEIRFVRDADLPEMLGIYIPIVRRTAISFEFEPPTEEGLRARIDAARERFPWLVCSDGAQVHGYAYAARHRAREAYQWSVESSVYVHENQRRRAVGRALYAALLEILRRQGYYNVYAGITLPNDPSISFHSACGFTEVGTYRAAGYKLGAWHDVSWWQRALQEARPEPRPPTPLHALDRHAVSRALATGTGMIR